MSLPEVNKQLEKAAQAVLTYGTYEEFLAGETGGSQSQGGQLRMTGNEMYQQLQGSPLGLACLRTWMLR